MEFRGVFFRSFIELLLLDEPTAALDPQASKMICSHIRNYARAQNCAVLWTSHDMPEIEEICDRVLLLSGGKLLLDGNPRELGSQFGAKNLEDLFLKMGAHSVAQ